MNEKTWAHYTYKNSGTNHVVCVAAMPGKKLSAAEKVPVYGKAVVNKGESYILWNHKWKDWKYFKSGKVIKKILKAEDMRGVEMDNFGIKAYLIK